MEQSERCVQGRVQVRQRRNKLAVRSGSEGILLSARVERPRRIRTCLEGLKCPATAHARRILGVMAVLDHLVLSSCFYC